MELCAAASASVGCVTPPERYGDSSRAVPFDPEHAAAPEPANSAMNAVSDLPAEWRETIAKNWHYMLPHMRRGLARIQQRLDAENDPDACLELADEIARRREKIGEAEAAIASWDRNKADSVPETATALDILLSGLNAVTQPAEASGRTMTLLQIHPRNPRTKSMARSLIARLVARAAKAAHATTD